MVEPTLQTEADETPVNAQELDASMLVQWRDAAEESTIDARKYAERDRDYYDNKQLTDDEIKNLKKRGQPPVIINRIKRKVEFLAGMEKRQRATPKAMPRTPVEEQNADSATDALRYVIEDQRFDVKRSRVWENLVIEGAGGYEVCVEQKSYGLCVAIRRVAWDRMFWDPHSSEADFSDAKYQGIDIWMDEDDALAQYGDNPDVKEILAATYTSSSPARGDTYDDKPRSGVWADRKRRRIRISQMYFKISGTWYYAEFTYGGVLKGGVSPYVNEDGEPECAFLFQSAYVDRDNNRYGVVREMISPQDEFNKRRSKLLHHLTVRQLRYDSTAGGVQDIEQVRKEFAKTDGVVDAPKDAVEVLPNTDQVAGQFNLLQQTSTELDLIGANSALLGEQGGAPSGKAIQLNQSGGLVELGNLFDGLRHLDRRVFDAVWNRIRQFWTAEKWVRVTDDERNIRFVGYNIDPMKQAMLQQAGMPGNISMMQRPIGELYVDITIEDAPEGIAPQMETFNSLVQLKQAGPASIPTEFLIETMPTLKSDLKAKLRDALDQSRQPGPEQQIKLAGAQAEVENIQSKTMKNVSDAQKNAADTQHNSMKALAQLLTAMQPLPQPTNTNQLSQ
jgi:hypothetical protein